MRKSITFILIAVVSAFTVDKGRHYYFDHKRYNTYNRIFKITDFEHLYDPGPDHTTAIRAALDSTEKYKGTLDIGSESLYVYPYGIAGDTPNFDNGVNVFQIDSSMSIIGAGSGLSNIYCLSDTTYTTFLVDAAGLVGYLNISGIHFWGARREHNGSPPGAPYANHSPKLFLIGTSQDDTVHAEVYFKDVKSRGFVYFLRDNHQWGLKITFKDVKIWDTGTSGLVLYGRGFSHYTLDNVIIYRIGIEDYYYTAGGRMGAHGIYAYIDRNTLIIDNCYFGYDPLAPDSSAAIPDTTWDSYAITLRSDVLADEFIPTTKIQISNTLFVASCFGSGVDAATSMASFYNVTFDSFAVAVNIATTPDQKLDFISCAFYDNLVSFWHDTETNYGRSTLNVDKSHFINTVNRSTNIFQLQDSSDVLLANSYISNSSDSAGLLVSNSGGVQRIKFINNHIVNWNNTNAARLFYMNGGGELLLRDNIFDSLYVKSKLFTLNGNFDNLSLYNNRFIFKAGQPILTEDLTSVARLAGGENTFQIADDEMGMNEVIDFSGAVAGGLKFKHGEYGDTLRSDAADRWYLSPNYDTYYHQNADSGSVANFYIFSTAVPGWKGAEFTVIGIDSLWFGSGGNIVPDSTTARPAGSVARFFYDDLANKWREK